MSLGTWTIEYEHSLKESGKLCLALSFETRHSFSHLLACMHCF